MQLNCRSCGQAIPADEINIKLAIAKCVGCSSVFSFADQLASPQRQAAIAERPKVPTPKGYTIENWGPDFLLTRKWFKPTVLLLLGFCVIWDGFLVVWYGAAFSGKEVSLIMVLFPLLHVTVGVGLTYFVICSLVNRTQIKVSSGVLTVKHGPLPWPGNHTLNAKDVKQLYCQSHYHRGKHGGRYTYEVQALLSDGTKQKLVSGLDDPDEAVFVEQQLEDHLRIEDQRVPGEMDQ